MKKVTYFLVLAISVFILTSCEKEKVTPTPDPNTGITIDQLVGDWNFESIEIDGDTNAYTTCIKTNNGRINFLNVTNVGGDAGMYKYDGTFTWNNECNGTSTNWHLNVKNNTLLVDNGNGGTYTIENSETFNGTVLKLRYVGSNKITTLQHSN